jgi:hypothetical protein
MMPSQPNSNYGERHGQRVSASHLQSLTEGLAAARNVTVADGGVLEASAGPEGLHLALNRASLDIRRYKLIDDLPIGGHANASVVAYDAEEDTYTLLGEEFVVWDALGAPETEGGADETAEVKRAAGEYGLAKWHPDSGRWEDVAGGDASVWAKVTDYGPDGEYSWIEQVSDGAGGLEDGSLGGTCKAWVEVLATATEGTWAVNVRGADSGTFTLTLEGSETSDLDHDATASEIDAALEAVKPGGSTVAVTGTGGRFSVVTTGITTPTLTASYADLAPAEAVDAATDVNETDLDPEFVARLYRTGGKWRFAAPWVLCPGQRQPGYTPGILNAAYLDENGCWYFGPTEEC